MIHAWGGFLFVKPTYPNLTIKIETRDPLSPISPYLFLECPSARSHRSSPNHRNSPSPNHRNSPSPNHRNSPLSMPNP